MPLFKLHTLNRGKGRGGGLALVTKRHLRVSQLRTTRSTFEAACWRVKCRNTEITIHRIYHPPYSLTNKTTNAMFIDDFCEYASTQLPDNPNNIFIGDFNLHVSDDQDTDSAIFNDSIDAICLYQHVQFQMHRSGNILDLLLSDITQSTRLLTVAPGPYISDHRAVIATLKIKKVCPKAEVREVRKLHKVTKEEWNNIINVDNLTLSGNLGDMVDSLDKELARIQDEAAPKKKCTICT